MTIADAPESNVRMALTKLLVRDVGTVPTPLVGLVGRFRAPATAAATPVR